MTVQHKQLSEGKWKEYSFAEQMANIGSEVERALNWRAKKNEAYSKKAFNRALELLELTIGSLSSYYRLKELTRVREALKDFFMGKNQFSSSDKLWKKYFMNFTYLSRKNH